MVLDLNKIDWTAIGSIVTFIAMIIAYYNILVSAKLNKKSLQFQTLLLERDIEQKRLDELIDIIIKICHSMKPIDVVDYSVKLVRSNFTEDDRHILDNMAAMDEYNSYMLDVKLVKFQKTNSIKNVIQTLTNIHQRYGEWVRIISQLNISKKEGKYDRKLVEKIINCMYHRTKDLKSSFDDDFLKIYNSKLNDLDKAIYLLNIYCYAISGYILEQKHIFEKDLNSFVEQEQNRIDNIMTINKFEKF